MKINASYIKCRADALSATEYECEHKALKEPVTVVAYSRKDADTALDEAIADDVKRTQFPDNIRTAKKMRKCPNCDGEGEVEE